MTNKNEILVSIIIPTYKRPDYLKQAIDSCLVQTYSNLEIIVVNDNPKLSIKKIIEQYNDNRIFLIEGQSNQGAPGARNLGLAKAKGDYINFLDDDDILYPQKIEKQLQFFKTSKINNVGIFVCDVFNKRNGQETVLENRAQGDMYEKLLNSYCIYTTHAMLIKRKVLIENNICFDTSLLSSQEYDLQIQLSKKSNFDFVPEILCEWQSSENQISKNLKKKIKGTYIFFNKYKNDFKSFGWLSYVRNYYLRQIYLYAKNIINLIL